MTTIAWDGTTLAGDRLVTGPYRTTSLTKIRRAADGRLIGAAGHVVFVSRFLDYLECPAGSRPEHPAFQNSEDESVHALEVMPDGVVWFWERGGSFAVGTGPMAAGSGGKYALGAMAAGKSAAEAVAIAATLSECTGSVVDTLTLRHADPAQAIIQPRTHWGDYDPRSLGAPGSYHGLGLDR